MTWGYAVLGIAAGLALTWVVLVGLLWWVRPDHLELREALRLGPDLVRLVRRLATDPSVPSGVRIRLGLLLAYLICPVDIVPDVVPVIGYADDAIVVAVALRSVVRRAGAESIDRLWPGTPDGLAVVHRLAGLAAPGNGPRPAE